MANARKMDVPDIGGLLGRIAEKRHDLPKAPIQSVNPVGEKPAERKAVEPAQRQNKKAEASTDDRTRGVGGRPSTKKDDVEYVKLSPRVPKALKKRVELALIEERYRDEDGNIVKTMDEFVALALDRLLGNT
jgi:hypothetical protein